MTAERERLLLEWLFLNDHGNAPVFHYEHDDQIEIVSIEPAESGRLRVFVRDHPAPAALPRIVVGTFADMARWPPAVIDGLLAQFDGSRA